VKIVFVTPEFVTEEYFSGGLANYIHRTSMALAQKGHNVHVIVKSDQKTRFDFDGVCVHKIPAPLKSSYIFRIFKQVYSGLFLDAYEQILFSFRVYKLLQAINKEKPIDIVQFPSYQACGLISCIALKVPMTIRISSYSPKWNEYAGIKRNLKIKISEYLEYLQNRLAKNIFAPSKLLKDIVEKHHHIKQVELIRTPFFFENPQMDYSVFNTNLKDKEYALFFGRLQSHKGIEVLVESLPEFFDRYPEAFMVFVGKDMPRRSSSMKTYIQSRLVKYRQRIIFIGQTRHSKLYPIIKKAKIIVLPSLIDNLPNTLLESMALGKAIIGTVGSSFDEILTDNKTGFLVEKENPLFLGKKMIDAWTSPALQEIGKAAQIASLSYLPEFTIKKLEQYYRDKKKISLKYD